VPVQASFDELGRPLREVTFCVVDLETTGGSAAGGSMITEVGAVKVRGGEVLGEFQTLVNPHQAIPPFIAVLTGITDAMVADSPGIAAVLPSFLEFASGCVLVAHNAPFDVGFLRHFATELGHRWPAFEVVDTARLARRVLTRDETPNCKLATLARHFRTSVEPNHRALSDAQATVEVLHGLMERLGSLGVHTLEELTTFSSRVDPEQRRKRHLAESLPDGPGVYLFRDARDRVLYIGTSKDLRRRVRSYFTASETRSRMGEMVRLAESVEAVPCATPLEAEVRELRLIGEHKPRYNRRSRHPERVVWLKLTREPWPRLSLVRVVLDDDADYVGPFSSRRSAQSAMAAAHDAFAVRQCTGRLPRTPSRSACVLAEMGRCLSPCDGAVLPEVYAAEVDRLRRALLVDPSRVVTSADVRMHALASGERFEEASVLRDRLAAFLRATARSQRLSAVTRLPQVVAARQQEDRSWEIHVIRHGRLAASAVMRGGVSAPQFVATVVAGAETVLPGLGPTPAASPAETECVLRWLERPGTRLIDVDGTWCLPAAGAGAHLIKHDAVESSRASLVPFDERRSLRTVHQP